MRNTKIISSMLAGFIALAASSASADVKTGKVQFARASENGYVRTNIEGIPNCTVIEFFTKGQGVSDIMSVLMAGLLSGRDVKVYYTTGGTESGACTGSGAELK